MKQRNFYIILVYIFSLIAFVYFINYEFEASGGGGGQHNRENVPLEKYRQESMFKHDTFEKLMLDFLHKLSAFAVDVNLLSDLRKVGHESSALDVNFEKYLQLSHIRHNGRAVFGVFDTPGLYNLTDYNIENVYNMNCIVVNRAKDILLDRLVLTHVYFKCRKYFIQLAVFHKRGDFLWVGSSTSSTEKALWFGDTPRAVNSFTLVDTVDVNFNTLKLPNDTDLFTFDYPHSKFLECNHSMAKNVTHMFKNYTQDLSLNERITPCVSHMSRTFDSLRKRYWLAAGALLGWYRDCGVIPFTHDLDFGVLSKDLDKELRDAFMAKQPVRTWLTLGVISSSFEIRTSGCGFTYDILVFYRRSKHTQCSSFHMNKIYSACFPVFDDICSGELLGRKFSVPCNTVDYLNTQYGKGLWEVPKSDNYQVPNTDWGGGRTYGQQELKYSYRYYDEDGKVMVKSSLGAINSVYWKFYGQNLTELPNDDYLYL